MNDLICTLTARCRASALWLTLFAAAVAQGAEPYGGWEPVGIAGGGSMFTPAISPVDPQRMMINCDMSAAYLSADTGRSWRMIHYSQLSGNTFCRPVFHPTESNTIYAVSGWSGSLKVTRDGGRTWVATGNLPAGLKGEIAIDSGNPDLMFAGVQDGVWRSTDAGKSWKKGNGPKGAAVGFHCDQTSPAARRICFAATTEGVWRSDDGGASWVEKSAGLPWRELRSFAGASNTKAGLCALYVAVPARETGGAYSGGVYRSVDRGEHWESAMGEGINKDIRAADEWAMGKIAEYHKVLAADAKPLTVYALNSNTGVKPPHHATVYRSDDGGKNWRATFSPDARFQKTNVDMDWRTAGAGQFYQEEPFGAAICPSDPERLLFCGSMGCFITVNGGVSWRACHAVAAASEPAGGPDSRWICNGLVVTTTWHYYVDPFERNRHYIAYTDIGFSRSLDAGKTWMWWGRKAWPPWQNTCYELAFDPDTKGRIWGAFSDTHDIPNENIISGRHRPDRPGGVCLSEDSGATWRKMNEGLPAAPVTALVLDPKSRAGARTLYAGVFDKGVFKSVDDGRTWKTAGEGLGTDANRRVCRLILHADGTLFALITAKKAGGKYLQSGVGLYRSIDGAGSWELVNGTKPLLWPKDFAVGLQDRRTIYLGASDLGHGNTEGGLYRTLDGGKSWELILRKGPQHFGAYLHPKRSGWVYATLCEGAPGSGLWLSRDLGRNWESVDGLPFSNIQRVEFDPADDSIIYVTTFGGSVWRGPADGAGKEAVTK